MPELVDVLTARPKFGVDVRVELLRVTAIPSSTTVEVEAASGARLTLPRVRAYSAPAVGDVVLVLRAGSAGWCLGALNAAASIPATPDPDPDPPEAGDDDTETGVSIVKPTFTGTYRSGWRSDTSDLYQGDWSGRGVNFGAAYYGHGLVGVPGTIVSARLTVRRLSGGSYSGVAPTMRLLAGKARPAGAPTSLDSATGPTLSVGETESWAVPSAWLADLNSGTAGGIGISSGASSPYARLAGRDSYAAAMALRAVWER